MAKPAKRTSKKPVTPKLLTPAVQAAVCKAVADGVPLKFAAAAAGVSPRSLHRWLADGRKPNAPAASVALVADIQKAHAEAVARNVQVVRTAADGGTWTAAAWWLERTHPDHFGTDRRELRELRKTLADLTARLARLAPDESKPTPPKEPAAQPPG